MSTQSVLPLPLMFLFFVLFFVVFLFCCFLLCSVLFCFRVNQDLHEKLQYCRCSISCLKQNYDDDDDDSKVPRTCATSLEASYPTNNLVQSTIDHRSIASVKHSYSLSLSLETYGEPWGVQKHDIADRN